jgi:hypothetical protein
MHADDGVGERGKVPAPGALEFVARGEMDIRERKPPTPIRHVFGGDEYSIWNFGELTFYCRFK